MGSIRKGEHMREEAMELAQFGASWGGDRVERKEEGKAPGCGRAAGQLPWT